MAGIGNETVFISQIETPIGVLQLASTAGGLLYIGLPCSGGTGLAGFLARRVPGAERKRAHAPHLDATQQLLEYLDGKRRHFALELDVRGTSFQHRVWDELLGIPFGETRSYGELAARLGQPGAARAVGLANGANPLPLVIPCHRVVAANGHLGGYGGGVRLKQRLLAMEQNAAGHDLL
jgi:O-6-methylguanine DNA methyltransferase